MKLSVTAKELPLDEETRQFVLRRLQFAVAKYSQAITSVSVALTDPARDGESSSVLCSIIARLRRGGQVSARDQHDDLRSAAATAAQRLSRTLALTLQDSHGTPAGNSQLFWRKNGAR